MVMLFCKELRHSHLNIVVVSTVFMRYALPVQDIFCVILYNLQILIVEKEKEVLEEQLEESFLL